MRPVTFQRRLDADTELRVLQEEDATTLYALIDSNREHLSDWLTWVPAIREVGDTRAFIRNTLARYLRGEGIACGLWHHGALVGVIECQAVDPHSRSTELGYWLDERHTGLGLASRACDVLLAHAFNELKLHKVVIRCPVGHDKSAGVARRLGFTQEGLLRAHRWLHESPVDEYVFGLLAHEWTQRGEEPDPSDSDEARPA